MIYHPVPPLLGRKTWPDWYRVGDDGSVWSRRKRGRNGGGVGRWSALKRLPNRSGILTVNLRCDDARSRQVAVSVLVCRAFHGSRPIGCVPCHYPDTDRTNCRADNLRWAPPGTVEGGVNPHEGRPHLTGKGRTARLSGEIVRWARECYAAGSTAEELAAELGVGRHVVNLAVTGRTYRRVGGPVGRRRLRVRGTGVNRAKLDELVVIEVRQRRAAGESLRGIARGMGVSMRTIYSVVTDKSRAYVVAGDEV